MEQRAGRFVRSGLTQLYTAACLLQKIPMDLAQALDFFGTLYDRCVDLGADVP